MASKKRSCLTLSQVLDDVFASSGSEELGESSNMISEDEGDVNFRRPPGRGAVLIDSESELDGEISRNSSRSAGFDQDSGGSEPDDVDLGPGDLSDDGSHSSRQSSSPSPPPTLPIAHLDVDTELCKIIPSRGIEIVEKNPSLIKRLTSSCQLLHGLSLFFGNF